jgi:signal transduction histidine kinase
MNKFPPESAVTVQYLQLLVEQEKTALARVIHDDLGGMLITTAMDLALLKRRFAGSDAAAIAEIDRATASLTAAVDMMRRVTEELHPTLLDNVGLLSALHWLLNSLHQRTAIDCRSHFETEELRLSPETAITLFRIGQEALLAAEHRAGVTRIDFYLSLENSCLTMKIQSDGSAAAPSEGSRGFQAIAFLRHRVEAMDGTAALDVLPGGDTAITVQIQLDPGKLSETQRIRALETLPRQ